MNERIKVASLDDDTSCIKVILLMLLAAACVTVATASTPATENMPDNWMTDSHYINNDSINTRWWASFGDTTLNRLVELAESRNYDLRQAVRRVEISRKAVMSARSTYYPQINVNAGWTRAQSSGATTAVEVPTSRNDYWNAGASMSWEVDVFGKVNAQVKQRQTQVKLSRVEYDAALISLQAEVATNYVNLRVYQTELEVARTHSKNQLDVVHITEARHKAGLASALDVSQAKTVYYSTIAQIPKLETSIRATINAIAVLVGEYPERLSAELATPAVLPDCERIIAVGLPLDLINRRPDIAQARLNVESAAQGLGIARRDYLPSFAINGSIGTSAHKFKGLMKDDSFTYTVAPTLSWTLFDGFARGANSATARLNLENEIDNYNLTVLTAVEEVDNAMSSYLSNLEYLESITEVVNQSEESERLSIDLYKNGLSAFTNVVDAQLNVLEYHNSQVVARGDALVSLINLYKSLGGGWQNYIE